MAAVAPLAVACVTVGVLGLAGAGWVGYYRLRGLTLFDFETGQPLAAE